MIKALPNMGSRSFGLGQVETISMKKRDRFIYCAAPSAIENKSVSFPHAAAFFFSALGISGCGDQQVVAGRKVDIATGPPWKP
ncbi:hypothetical protein [Stutzerimonas nitrititolerans]|uniref:hypothetical protein n=1 Tax=Stutzerimonas nitrititolerans TaxID=2482751 RepID=UPI00289C0CD1|nr:hypothetical protein [Stutzerimonas nitrititolerans]